MKFIIVGKGSIGKRHGAILEKFNHKVHYLSRDNSGKISKQNFEKRKRNFKAHLCFKKNRD